jgi:dimethylhistidine N-methyltransferase
MEAAALKFTDESPATVRLRDEVIAGLSASPKRLSPKLFYDAEGSRLFDAICRTPEYYPTRSEMGILQERAGEIAALVGPGVLLIEPGSGSSDKVRLLLDALRPGTYMPMDISRDHLYAAARRLALAYPWLTVHAACADFTLNETLPLSPSGMRRVVFFPGSTIGNFEPEEAVGFLRRIAGLIGPDGGLLIGVDLKKDAAILNRAYNDGAGITAAFNRNLLNRVQRELGARVDVGRFEHCAFYNADQGRVEMHLRSTARQSIEVEGYRFVFQPGESIHTENSYKYSIDEFTALANRAGLGSVQTWTDEHDLFSVHYLTPLGE